MTEKLNYEAKIVACNGAVALFDFHAPNLDSATSHVQHLINDENMVYEWVDIKPNRIHHISFKKKGNKKWNCIIK